MRTQQLILKAWLCCLFLSGFVGQGITAQTTVAPTGTWVKPTDPQIQYVGRVSFKNPEAPCFTYPGVQIRAAFEGTSLRMVAKPNSGYFMVQIDEAQPFKVAFTSPKDSIVSLATALPKGNHTVRIMNVLEAYERRPEFKGFLLDEGCQLVTPPALPTRKIEFIGNSITCGYGVEASSGKVRFSEDTENHYYTYAAIAARALNAQHYVTARSGIGIYRNYNGPKEGNPNCMPALYLQTLFGDSTEVWDCQRYQPDLVCVNLGTNDCSTKGYDPVRLKAAYVRFGQRLRQLYPTAKIVWLSGCMLSGEPMRLVERTLDEVTAEANAAGDKEVYRFTFSPQNGDLGYGADSHPSIGQQRRMADELIPFLRQLMGW